MGHLIDSNVLSEFRKPRRAEHVTDWFRAQPSADLYTSVLVIAELRRGSFMVRQRDARAADGLDLWIADLEQAFEDRVLPVSAAVANLWARLTVPDPLPVIDGLLAATALCHDLTLVTRNTRDVARTGVKRFDPFEIPDSASGGG